MPTYDCLGPDNCYCVKDAREAAIKPNEQRAVGPSHVQPTWSTPVKHVELMPQHQDFGLKASLRPEAVAQHADEQEGNCEHPSIMF